MDSPYPLTEELRSYARGDRKSVNPLVEEILPRMKRIAASKLNRERAAIPVTPTDLVGEVWAGSLHRGRWQIENRNQFFAIVGLAMQNVLTDMARRRLAERRGNGAIHVSLEMVTAADQPTAANAEEVVLIGLLLEQLARENERVAAVVRSHYVAGYSLEEIASESGLTLRQVRHLWHKGKLWLAKRLASQRPCFKPGPPDPG
jgi:RNA polymerase sigma factor (TIGR02999 family)